MSWNERLRMAFCSPLSIPQNPFSSSAKHSSVICCLYADGTNATSESKNQQYRKKRRPRAVEGAQQISEVSVGDEFIGKICDVGPADSSWIEIGVATSTGKAVRARLRHNTGKKENVSDVPGGIIPVYVHKVNRPAARIEVVRGTAPPPKTELRVEDVRMLSTLEVAEELKGTVLATGDYGAVVDVNVFRLGRRGRVVTSTGLLPRKQFREEWASQADLVIRSDIERTIRVGDAISVFVRIVNPLAAFLSLTATEIDVAAVEQEMLIKKHTNRRLRRRPSLDVLQAGEVRHGTVREIAKFGLFVDIGVKKDGLIHFSRMGRKHQWDWKEVIAIGTEVSVEVTSVSSNQIGLSLLEVKGEEEEEAISKALLPTARIEDVATAEKLRGQRSRAQKRRSPRKGTKSLDHSQPENLELKSSARNEKQADDNEEEGEDEDDEIEVFSDEYFEDKYG